MELELPEESGIAEKDTFVSKEGYENRSPTDETQLQNIPTSSGAKVGMMTRFKSYFTESADLKAQNALSHVAPHLSASNLRGYTPQEHDEAYLHPAIISECPIVWIARDTYGVSAMEVRATSQEAYMMTDEGAVFNDKGKVEWRNEKVTEAPIWEDEVAY